MMKFILVQAFTAKGERKKSDALCCFCHFIGVFLIHSAHTGLELFFVSLICMGQYFFLHQVKRPRFDFEGGTVC